MINVAQRLVQLRTRAGLSRNELARRAGYQGGTSLQYYEKPENWVGKRYPVEFVARISRVLIGAGEPSIVDKEVWALAENKTGTIVIASAVVSIPVLGWAAVKQGNSAVIGAPPEGSIEAVGLPPSNYFALVAERDYSGAGAPKGAHLICDAGDIELRDGRRYLIVWQGEASVRRYFSNPARFESEAAPAEPTVFPTGPVEIVARIVRVVIDF